MKALLADNDMPFRTTQLGRYGCVDDLAKAHARPDFRAAHLLAADGSLSQARPDLHHLLSMKGFYDDADALWQQYTSEFNKTLKSFGASINLLEVYCSQSWQGLAAGTCLHELTPPLHHWNLRGFPIAGKHTVITTGAGLAVDLGAAPIWNYVIDQAGEILIGAEDFRWIKHSSISAGLGVWAAGQLGIDRGELRLIDLDSGHFVRHQILPMTNEYASLQQFATEVFRLYCDQLKINCLTPNFGCV